MEGIEPGGAAQLQLVQHQTPLVREELVQIGGVAAYRHHVQILIGLGISMVYLSLNFVKGFSANITHFAPSTPAPPSSSTLVYLPSYSP